MSRIKTGDKKLQQSIFKGLPEEERVACVDYDGLLKFGINLKNIRTTWASGRYRGADWVQEIKGTTYKQLTSLLRI